MSQGRPSKVRPLMKEKIHQPISEGKENENIFEDETGTLHKSAAENYFMQGKSGNINRARRGRKQKNGSENDSSSDDDTSTANKELTSQYSLQNLSSFIEGASKMKNKEIVKMKHQFTYWTNVYLGSDFNICFIGAGSKNALLELYRKELSSLGENTFIVDGFKEESTARAILQALCDHLNIKKGTNRNLVNLAEEVTKTLKNKQQRIFMFLHNIDSPTLRDSVDQRVLATLSSTPYLRLIATTDHVKTTIMWDSETITLFNFVFLEVSTFDFSLDNLLASKSATLGLNPKNNTSAHTMSSLDVLWQSLAENARKIFRIFFAMTFETGQSVPFWDLFNAARDDFLVSSDAALRQLLVEFEDHRVLNRRRREDGNENLIACIDRDLIKKFLTEKGISLEI